MTGVCLMRRVVLGVSVLGAFVLCVGVAPVFALGSSSSSVWWGLTSGSQPSNLPENGAGRIIVTAQNRGYGSVDGSVSPVVVRDVLPVGLKAKLIEGLAGEGGLGSRARGALKCSLPSSQEGECTFEGPTLPPFEQLEVRIAVEGQGASAGEVNTVSVSGGGATGEKTFTHPLSIGEETRFGVENNELLAEEEGGVPATQAGKHPFQLTSVFALNTSVLTASADSVEPAAMAKDLMFRLPPGLVGNPTPFAQCTDVQFATTESVEGEHGRGFETHNECPAQTAIGTATITFNPVSGGLNGVITSTVPLFNLTPDVGEPAKFGFEVDGARTYLDTAVRTGGDYGVTVSVDNITQVVGFLVSKVTFWGVPGAAIHDSARGWACLTGLGACTNLVETQPPPFLSLPTACTGPMSTSVQADSWAQPHPPHPTEAPLFVESMVGGLDGCNQLHFAPEISVAPDVSDASTSTGLTVGIRVPQEAALNPEGLAESALRELTVTLPEGVTVNPSDADGLEACSENEIGYLPEQSLPGALRFTAEEQSCPDASKIGEVEIETPLLPHTLKGFVYLAAPAPLQENGMNPFGSLVAMYVIAKDPISGTLIKTPVRVSLDPGTGRLVAISQNIPELPFEDLRLHMFGGERAPLSTPPTPASCPSGYTTTASFAPWSGTPTVQAGSTFQILSGPNGSPCQGPRPFTPSLTAGTTSIQAGGFSPFTMTMSREDGQQDLQAISLHMPPGLSGLLSGVKLCGETEANTGTCGPESEIGETIVSVGVGNEPYTVTGGKVYITGPYNGAPFGLSIVNPANAGPFHLGNVIVRAKIEVDPTTADLTITSDNSGPYKIPQLLDGIPLQIKHVNVTINRPGFTFNPTNCNPLTLTGNLFSSEGATAGLSVPFQATNCAVLGFAPKFAVSTQAKTSKANGASLSVKLTYPNAPFGSQANISKVKVDLPKQLPSRLTTLQKACTAAQFNANPAGCPTASIVGHAKAVTPLLPVPLEGPAYFVSHGGEAFPSLIMVLQGDNVTLNLVGTTFISKAGITSSTFKTVPDAPVGSFELTLPEDPYSALAANGNLCATKMVMPTEFAAQNGAVIHKNTKVTVTGCPKAKKAKKKHKKTKNKNKKNKKGKGKH
jgi:hypothetical protein